MLNSTISTATATLPPMTAKRFCDKFKVPHILIDIKMKNAKKTPKGVQHGWTNWTFAQCETHNNKTDVNSKCKYMLINLKAAGLVCVDIDGGDIDAAFNQYGKMNYTKSVNKQLPHIYFNKTEDDPNGTRINVKQENVDFLYSHVFEHTESIIHNYNEYGLDDFDWEEYIDQSDCEPPKNNVMQLSLVNSPHEPVDVTDGHLLLDLINIKYWTKFDTWRNLIWACVDHFGMSNGIAIAIKYSKMVGAVYEEGCVEQHAKNFKEGLITWGTAHYFARISNPDEYALLMSPDIKGDDESLAELFLYAFGENITKDKFGNDYIFFRGAWKKSNKETANLIKSFISKETQKIMNTSLKLNMKKMHELAADSPEYEKLNKMCHIINDSINKIRSSTATSNVYSKVKDILARRLETDIIFDTGKDQLYNIQFANGIYELNNKRFRSRTKEDYITQTLSWNYEEERKQENIDIVNMFFQKVQPNDEMRDFQKCWLANCLDGNVGREKFKFNIGAGSNGKSLEFSIHHICFPLYTTKFDNRVFNNDYDKFHKDFHELSFLPIRLAYMEELDKTKKLNIDRMKDIITGKKLSIEIMFGTKVNVDSQATLNICSNHNPNATVDGGILRRGILQRYDSTFEKRATDDFKNHFYIKDENFDSQFDNDDMKLAYFHVLVDNYKKIDIPELLENSFKTVLNEHDEFKVIFDDLFTINPNKNSRTARLAVVTELQKHMKNPKWRDILQNMRNQKAEYDPDKSIKGKKGVFTNIYINEEHEVDDEDSDASY